MDQNLDGIYLYIVDSITLTFLHRHILDVKVVRMFQVAEKCMILQMCLIRKSKTHVDL